MAINPFLEEQLPIGIKMGATYGDEYNVEIIKTKGGSEYRRLVHPYPVRHYSIGFINTNSELWTKVLALYHRAYGMYAGFRVKALDDFSTNGHVNTPTGLDQTAALVSTGIYQLQKAYGVGGTPLGIGLPVRTLFKPVSGSTKMGASGTEIPNSPVANWTVDTTTGLVTFAANKTANVSGAITKVSSAVIPCTGHSFLVGETVFISGCAGMTQINNLRGQITAISAGVSVTVNINSTAFSTWTSGGVLNTRPQVGEAVTCGCYFDIPFRFDSRLDLTHTSDIVRDAPNIDIIEVIAL